jgi:oligopeptide/dipeptide ABC transporter ATP-binding protein
VEVSDAESFFAAPLHPYSQKLMASVPRLHGDMEPEFITGRPPSLLDLPTGCRFKDRCPFRMAKCEENPPVIVKDNRIVQCWLYV